VDTGSDPYTVGISSCVDKANDSIAVACGTCTSMEDCPCAACPARSLLRCVRVGGSLLLMWVVEEGVAVMEAVATAVYQQGKFGSP